MSGLDHSELIDAMEADHKPKRTERAHFRGYIHALAVAAEGSLEQLDFFVPPAAMHAAVALMVVQRVEPALKQEITIAMGLLLAPYHEAHVRNKGAAHEAATA
ncbi:hypothetical protein [Xanthomonas sp. 3058]|uniref:hypothetical protein n=1 Tax=Xanthomonas sp. 3058 TaxID=3035314 RepID=UPI001609A82A|nr:hypothetical protein [Xanthomonas sp. 3058]MBB5866195.1 hypothetical protein [Xanthomonas sp. 3058]